MTDNEKAATFIGWKPDQPCSHRQWYDGSGLWGNGITVCELCGCRNVDFARCDHKDRAYDMSQPENFMRALEAAVWWSRNHEGTWFVGGQTLGGEGEGKTPVIALAALYDAEHQGETE